uniref:hypothetical protein n=1 Tax=uncultured Draconibacterium sp. TaxID=1573823 RepID=UPI00321794F2
MKLKEKLLDLTLVSLIIVISFTYSLGQSLSDFGVKTPEKKTNVMENRIQFNGYTNHWQNNFTQWHRYGNLFKTATTDIRPTIFQSKIDAADDLQIPGLLLQERFVSALFSSSYELLNNPATEQLDAKLKNGNVLVTVSPESELGKELEEKAGDIFTWTNALKSYQFGATDFMPVKAFVLEHKEQRLFVISSADETKIEQLLEHINNTKDILTNYQLKKGWFGASTLLKSVTCTPGHPIELIGKGMNEGNSWFIFDGYMDFLAQKEIKDWVKSVDLPVVANVGFSPIYGCKNYNGLQVQDMATKQAWIDFAHNKGGYAFRPVYDPESDAFDFDGYFAVEGNKTQIDNENVPFINKTGSLSGNLTSSMVLFLEKGKALTDEAIWDAILNRKAVAVFEKAQLMGPDKFRNALQLLYLDKYYLENYFGDNIDIEAKVEGYEIVMNLKDYSANALEGSLDFTCANGVEVEKGFSGNISLEPGEVKEFRIPLVISKEAMGKTTPVAIHFTSDKIKKSTVAMLDLPPAISVHQLLYGHAGNIHFPVTIHNFSDKMEIPVSVEVYKKTNSGKSLLKQTKNIEVATSKHKQVDFDLELEAGDYTVVTKTLGLTARSQVGVGNAKGKNYVYEVDLNSDGVNEYRMENDSVMVTLLRTGARVIEYKVKSRADNVLFKIWPEKAVNDKRPFRKRAFYPFGGFEDFLGQASMETHQLYNAKIIRKEGDFVRVEMETDYFGNSLKKIFTLYGNSPLLEVRFELDFKNPEANVLGPQPILHLGKEHGTEDVFTVPTTDGLKEYRMLPEKYYGQAIEVQEGWNAGYDTSEDITFVGAFPVKQPLFLHMWMNHPRNTDAPHYYVEFQPWTPIIQKTTMYFSYYLWGSGGAWENGVSELRKRNLITTR